MTLEEIVSELDKIGDSLTICVAKEPNWTPTSEAELSPAEQPHKSRFPYFLEVAVAKNVLRAWSYVRKGRLPNLASKCTAIIYYAENDAYLLPEHEPEDYR